MKMKRLVAIFTASSLNFATISQTFAGEPQYLAAQSLAGWKDYGGLLGVYMEQGTPVTLTVTPANRPAYQLTVPAEFVKDVSPRTPAANADIRPGDEILFIDNNYFQNVGATISYIAGQWPGHVVEVEIFRDGKLMTANIPLASRTNPTAPPPAATSSNDGVKALLGLGAVAVIGCAVLGCFSSGSSSDSSGGSGGSSNAPNDDWKYNRPSTPSTPNDGPGIMNGPTGGDPLNRW